MGPYAGVDSPCVPSKVDSNTFILGQTYVRVDLNPMPAAVRVDFIFQSGTLDLASVYSIAYTAQLKRRFFMYLFACRYNIETDYVYCKHM
jgi:hypothetical protein